MLARYAHRLLALPALTNSPFSTLEEIEKRSEELLAKGVATRFVDKAGDSEEVAKLVERLREAITHYQVSDNCFIALSTTHARRQISQQQAIYNQITNLTVRTLQITLGYCAGDRLFFKASFDVLLKFHEVAQCGNSLWCRLIPV